MKKWFVWVLVFSFVFVFLSGVILASTLDDIKARGKIIIGTD
ncbi:MAG: basic amino acid ABC transporter substrate-binding protein, partial [Candidatus Atribacteria bacterium]|nr:basic amino acid ABC transporter substrate-binding protein [Candidatus Atribacteria bacterium]